MLDDKGTSFSGPLTIYFVGYFATMFANGMFLKDLYDYAPHYGITNWEINNLWFINIPASFVPLVYYNSYKGVGDKLTVMSRVFMKHGLATGNEGKIYKGVRVKIIIFNMLAFLSCSFFTVTFGIYVPIEHITDASQVIVFSCCILSYYVFLPPISSASLELILFTLGVIKESLQYLDTFAQGLLDGGKVHFMRKSGIKKVISDGYELSYSMKEAEEMFGGMIACIYILYNIMITCGLFFGVDFLGVLVGSTISGGLLFCSLSIISSAVLGFTILYQLLQIGQELSDNYQSICDKLEQLLIEEAENMSTRQRTEMDVLINRFAHTTPLRPKNTFDMNYATGASLGGLILTYVIVLVQFKDSGSAPSAALAG